MRTVYGIQFQVKPANGESPAECLAGLRLLTASWVGQKYRKVWDIEVVPAFDGAKLEPKEGHWILSAHECHGECELLTMEWGHPDDQDDSVTWVTASTFARNGEAIHAAVSIRLSSTRFIVRPTRFVLGRPGIVWAVLTRWECSIAGQPVPVNHQVVAAADVAGFVEHVICAKERALAIIMVSPDVWTEKPVVQPDALQKALAGFAQVVVLADKQAAFALTYKVGKQLSCFDGAVRVYWPGFTVADHPFVHPLYLSRSIRYHRANGRELKTHFFRIFAGISAFRAGELGPIREVRRSIALEQKSASEAKELRILELEEENEQLTKDLAAALKNVTQVSQLWAAPHAEEDFIPDNASAQEGEVESVAAAVTAARSAFSTTLQFLSSAISLAEDCPFKEPKLVFRLFEVLDEFVRKWRSTGQIGTTWKTALADKGYAYKPDISSTCKQKKLVTDYRFKYDGQTLVFGEHVTIGVGQDPQKCMSVHWHRDEKKKILVIGRCGKHGRNTLT